jgi:SAM-dependent methyltransferase
VTAYGTDLAFIHDAGHGALARHAALQLLAELERAGHSRGTIVDLGCGSGILAGVVADAGYDVVGIDVSAEMIALARGRVPKGTFTVGSFVDALAQGLPTPRGASSDIPECVAVAAIGEVLNYTFDPANDTRSRSELFERIMRSLAPGGVFLFDVAGPNRQQPDTSRRSYATGPDWAVLVETTVNDDRAILTREITTFRRTGELFRRDSETHRLTLFEPADVLAALQAVGFDVQMMTAYGSLSLPDGLPAFLGRRQVQRHRGSQ